MNEADLIPIVCAMLLGGEAELRLPFSLNDSAHYVRVDCVTDTHAIEIGLDDRRSSLDSLQQALFYGALLDRAPMVTGAKTQPNFRLKPQRVPRAWLTA